MSNEQPRLRTLYKEELVGQLQKTLGLKNVMEVPRLEKITLNMGVGEAAQDKKIAKTVQKELSALAGQHAVITLARKSVAGFKIREGWPVGSKVTLRGDRMYDFLERVIAIALPCTRDFRGLNPKAFDGRGNYTMGLKEHIIFPEIDYDKVDKVRGLDIVFTTSAKTNEHGLALLKAFRLPFRDSDKSSTGVQ